MMSTGLYPIQDTKHLVILGEVPQRGLLMQTIDIEKLKKLMEYNNLSQRGLSLKAGLSDTAVRDIINGKSQVTRPQTIIRLAMALDVPAHYLISMAYFDHIIRTKPESASLIMKDFGVDFHSLTFKDQYGNVKFKEFDEDRLKELMSDKDIEEIKNSKNFTGANLKFAKMIGAQLQYSRFKEADLSGADLSSSNLSNSIFIGANLTNTNLYDSNLSNCDFFSANLTGANLKKADLSGANFSGVDLSSINWG